MAGRVLRNSKGRFAGSTKGWGRQAGKPASRAERRKVVRHTIKQAGKAGARGAGRRVLWGARSGAQQGLKIGAAGGIVVGAAVLRNGGSRGTAVKAAATTLGVAVTTASVRGAVTSRPISAARGSASASAQLGLANRKTAIDAKRGITRKQSLSRTYKGYGRAGSVLRGVRQAKRLR
jgi:hypothetical protein